MGNPYVSAADRRVIEARRLKKFVYCLCPGCDFAQHKNGVCQQHFEKISAAVEAGEAEWEDIANQGYARLTPPEDDPDYPRDNRRRKRPRDICLAPGCVKDERSRGLCMTHYHIARRLIMKGKTTWGRLEAIKFSKRPEYVKPVDEQGFAEQIGVLGGFTPNQSEQENKQEVPTISFAHYEEQEVKDAMSNNSKGKIEDLPETIDFNELPSAVGPLQEEDSQIDFWIEGNNDPIGISYWVGEDKEKPEVEKVKLEDWSPPQDLGTVNAQEPETKEGDT